MTDVSRSVTLNTLGSALESEDSVFTVSDAVCVHFVRREMYQVKPSMFSRRKS